MWVGESEWEQTRQVSDLVGLRGGGKMVRMGALAQCVRIAVSASGTTAVSGGAPLVARAAASGVTICPPSGGGWHRAQAVFGQQARSFAASGGVQKDEEDRGGAGALRRGFSSMPLSDSVVAGKEEKDEGDFQVDGVQRVYISTPYGIDNSETSEQVDYLMKSMGGLPPGKDQLDVLAESGLGGAASHAARYPTANIRYNEHHHERFAIGEPSKKAFTYFVLTGGRFLYASAVRLLVLKFILSMTASKDVLALASLEVDLSNIAVGQTVTVKWRGKPVFIRHRPEAEVAESNSVSIAELRDPQTDADRRVKPEWLVVLGVCTHLGCVPISGAGDYNGWFCPCHGSHYDASGRIRKGPAPYNLEVPEYKFLEDDKVLIG